jgi:hypothetical protein
MHSVLTRIEPDFSVFRPVAFDGLMDVWRWVLCSLVARTGSCLLCAMRGRVTEFSFHRRYLAVRLLLALTQLSYRSPEGHILWTVYCDTHTWERPTSSALFLINLLNDFNYLSCVALMTTQMWPIWPSGDPLFDIPGLNSTVYQV